MIVQKMLCNYIFLVKKVMRTIRLNKADCVGYRWLARNVSIKFQDTI